MPVQALHIFMSWCYILLAKVSRLSNDSPHPPPCAFDFLLTLSMGHTDPGNEPANSVELCKLNGREIIIIIGKSSLFMYQITVWWSFSIHFCSHFTYVCAGILSLPNSSLVSSSDFCKSCDLRLNLISLLLFASYGAEKWCEGHNQLLLIPRLYVRVCICMCVYICVFSGDFIRDGDEKLPYLCRGFQNIENIVIDVVYVCSLYCLYIYIYIIIFLFVFCFCTEPYHSDLVAWLWCCV